MYDRILLPIDGSTGTTHVALQAIDLAQQYDSTIHVLHVVDTEVKSLLTGAHDSGETLTTEGESAIEKVSRLADSHGVTVETELREGSPASTILEFADEIDADLIVAGTHGRSGIERQLIGSVAERIVRHATCPVMTVRLPETDTTVDDESQARALATQALEERGHDATVVGIERQPHVWIVEADGDDGSFVTYVDPVTQRTSVVERS